MTKVIFIADKWCAGNKSFGISEWESNLYTSLQASADVDLTTFHFDEYFSLHGEGADARLLHLINEHKPDIIFLVIYKMPGSDVHVPTWETLKEIKRLAIPTIAIWGDLEMEEQVKISKAIIPYVSMNVATASSAAVERIGDPEHYIYTWVPKDPTHFNNPGYQRNIDVSYSGSPKKDRLSRIRFLEKNGLRVVTGGGERQEHKTTAQYADIYKRSKIALSFSRANLSHVVNARPFEAMLCGAMLLEQESFELPKMYIPFVDYVPYTSNADLLEKVRYYLAHEDERREISENGRKKTQDLYSAEKFWALVMKLAFQPSGLSVPTWRLSKESLTFVPPLRAARLRILDAISRSPILFSIYTWFLPRKYQEILARIGPRVRPLLERRLPAQYFDFILTLKRKLW